MSKFKYIGIGLLCFALSTCKKINYKTTKVRGVLWDYCREIGMADVEVQLIEGSYERGSSYSYKTIKTILTNTDGSFDFGEFEADKRTHKHFYKVVYVPKESELISKGPCCCGEPWNMVNLDFLKVKAAQDNFDTLRLCTLNPNKGIVVFYPPPPYDNEDYLTATSHLKCADITKNTIKLNEMSIPQNGVVYTQFSTADCGWKIIEREIKYNGKIKNYVDSIFVEWKSGIAFVDTIFLQ